MAGKRTAEVRRRNAVIYLILIIFLAIVSVIFEKTGMWDRIDASVTDSQYIELKDGEVAAEVHFIDVGQGDCTLIVSQNKTMLIDSGEAEYADTVLETFSDLGIVYLDYAVVSHAHSDHMGSMAEILDNISTGNVILSQPSDENSETKMYQD